MGFRESMKLLKFHENFVWLFLYVFLGRGSKTFIRFMNLKLLRTIGLHCHLTESYLLHHQNPVLDDYLELIKTFGLLTAKVLSSSFPVQSDCWEVAALSE